MSSGQKLSQRIRVARALRYRDPRPEETHDDERVEPAKPTHGPNRATMYVPFNDTRLSLGQGHDPYKMDTGIVGTTEEHIGWETKTAEGTGHGGGEADGDAHADEHGGGHGEDHGGDHGEEHGGDHGGGHGEEPPPPPPPPPGPNTAENLGGSPVFAHLTADSCPNGAVGYSLVTDGRAYWEAEKQHYVISTGGDVLLHAGSDEKRLAVLQSDQFVTEVNGGEATTLRANKNINVTAKDFEEIHKPDYATPFPPTPAEHASWLSESNIHRIADASSYVLEIASIVHGLQEPVAHEPGTHAHTSKAGWLAAITAGVNCRSVKYHPHDGIHFNADGEFAAGAGSVVGLFGTVAAEVVASLGALVLGGTSAIKGFAYGLVFGGLEACLNGLKTVKISSKGKVEVLSKKGTSIVGQKDVRMNAGHLAQLDGDEAALSGPKATVGAGTNFALFGQSDKMVIGKVADAKKYDNPKVDKLLYAGIWKEVIQFTAAKKVALRMSSSSCIMEAGGKQLKISSAGIKGHTPKLDMET